MVGSRSEVYTGRNTTNMRTLEEWGDVLGTLKCHELYYSPLALECSKCQHAVSCAEHSPKVSIKLSPIQMMICNRLKENPRISANRLFVLVNQNLVASGKKRKTTIAYHLKRLKRMGVVSTVRSGRKMVYSLRMLP